jgi:hypothetical protein
VRSLMKPSTSCFMTGASASGGTSSCVACARTQTCELPGGCWDQGYRNCCARVIDVARIDALVMSISKVVLRVLVHLLQAR